MSKARYMGQPTDFLETGKEYEIEISYEKTPYYRVRIYDKSRVLFKWLPHMEYATRADFLADWRLDV